MTDDLKAIKADEWRFREGLERSCAHSFSSPMGRAIAAITADYCAKMAEEAEGREAEQYQCKSSYPNACRTRCYREDNHCGMHSCGMGCCKWGDEPKPTDEPSADDVREVLAIKTNGTSGWNRLLRATLLDYAERKGIK